MSVTLNRQAAAARDDATRRVEKFIADLGGDLSCNEYDNTLDRLESEIRDARLANQRMRSCAILRGQP